MTTLTMSDEKRLKIIQRVFLLDGAVEFFHQKEKIASFDSKTTHTLRLYRTNAKREGFRYGPISSLITHDTKLSP